MQTVVLGIFGAPFHEPEALQFFGPDPHHGRWFRIVAETLDDRPRHAMRGSVSGHGLVAFGGLSAIRRGARVDAEPTTPVDDSRFA